MLTLVDTVGHEWTIEQSNALLGASEQLCVEAGGLIRETRAARAASVAVRRRIRIPAIHGGTEDVNPALTNTRRFLIRSKLADGQLPVEPVARLWGGPGRGESCDGCEAKIQPPCLIMEAVTTVGRALLLHVECFYIWDAERQTSRHRDRADTPIAGSVWGGDATPGC